MARPTYDDVEDLVLSSLTHEEQLRLVGAMLADMVEGGRTANEAREALVAAIDGAVLGSAAFDAFIGQSNRIH